jgi:TPP-dependent pyruvate/acetoin dehydrogenase alpha subunit
MGHFYGDQMPYMDKEELARRMSDHPVDRLRAQVVSSGAADDAALDAIDAELQADVAAAVAEAQGAAAADPGRLLTDIYAEVGR